MNQADSLKQSFGQRAPLSGRLMLLGMDLAFATLLFAVALEWLDGSPLPRPIWIAWIFALAISFYFTKKLSGRTPGGWVFAALPRAARPLAMVATWIVTAGIAVMITENQLLLRRAWLQEENAETSPTLAGPWAILPFYYSLGAWPQKYQGRPVFHALPYERSVPDRFIPRVIARWRMPDIRVTFEGPQTPSFPGSEPILRTLIRDCFLGASGSSKTSDTPGQFDCIRLRETTLARVVTEMKPQIHPITWDLSWLHVKNPAVPPAEEIQGLFISAKGKRRAQDRFILITEKGIHQSFILDFPPTPEGETARQLFRASLRSLRASDSLIPGRAWADESLQRTQLASLARTEALGDRAGFLGQIASAQALLIAKASVDSHSFDAFFHLGGTAMLLSRFARKEGAPPNGIPTKENFDDWMALPKLLGDSALRYARDISPNDPRIPQLEMLAIEAK